MADEQMIGDPIPKVFPPDDPVARFVVSMSMANNDIEWAFRDLLRAADEDTPDFTFRVRVVIGYLVEAIDALNFYSAQVPEVRTLLERLPADAREQLKIVRGALQKAGPKALAAVRDNTFHYPSPNPAYKPKTSDEQLRDTLAALSHIGVHTHYDGDTHATRFNFADEAAFNLAMGGPSTTNDEALRRSEIARNGGLAFIQWAPHLVLTYMKTNRCHFGDPIISDKTKPPTREDADAEIQ
jgi:hypothetical protein